MIRRIVALSIIALLFIGVFPLSIKIASSTPPYSEIRGIWRLDEGAGATAHDSSGNGNDGTLKGATLPTWVAGKYGNALSFSGDDYVDVLDSNSLDVVGAITIEAWIYLKKTPTDGIIAMKYNHTTLSSSYYLGMGGVGGNKINFALSYNGNNYYQLFSLKNITLNTWTHIAAVMNGTHMLIYINGVLDASRTYPPGTIFAGTANMRFGCYLPEAGYPRYFNGSIDEIKIFSYARSPPFTQWNVDDDRVQKPNADFTSIEAACLAVAPGDKINVYSGTYNEEVVIDKAVEVKSVSGAASTVIDGTGVALASAGLVKITAASGSVKFDGFTVKKAGAVGPNNVRVAVFASSSGSGPFTISNNLIYGSNDDSEEEDYGFYSSNNKADVLFTRNTVTQTGANNILFELHTGKTEISYNNLDAGCWGADSIFIMTYNGVNVTKEQRIAYNTFDMGTGSGFDYSHRATGVSFAIYPGFAKNTTFTNMLITGNTFNNLKSNRRGIGFWNAETGPNLVGASITYNTINGISKPTGSYGIDFYGLTVNTIITNNKITGVETGISLRNGDAPGTKINQNCIVGNTVGVDWTLGSSPVDATYNWWGDSTGPYNPTANPSGLGNPVTAKVLFDPWLKAFFDYSRKNPVVNEPITLDASLMIMPCMVQHTIKDYFWKFGDGTLEVKHTPITTHAFATSGTKNVTLMVRYEDLTTYTTSEFITVAEEPVLRLVPDSIVGKHIYDTFTVNVTIVDLDANQRFVGAEFRIQYNSTLLDVVSASAGSFILDSRWNKHNVFTIYNVFPEFNQVVVGVILLPNASGQWEAFPYGDGTLVTLNFSIAYQERGVEKDPLSSCLVLFNTRLVDDSGMLLPHASEFTVNVDVKDLLLSEKFVGCEFHIAFDTDRLDIISGAPGPLVADSPNGVLIIIQEHEGFDEAVVGLLLLPNASGQWSWFPSGSGTLLTLTFRRHYSTLPYEEPFSCEFALFNVIIIDNQNHKFSHALTTQYMKTFYKVVPTHLADVNYDGYVGIDDIFTVASAFGSEPGRPRWNADFDFNKDDYVGIDDIFFVASNFGWEIDC
jgi:hypothetical protein